MDRKLRKYHKNKENGGKPVEKKQRLRVMRTELSIEEQIQLAANNKLYSNKNPEKGIRIVTVICYFFSISLAAIVLSVYYVYFWHPEYRNTTTIRTTNCDLAKEISARTVNATEIFYNKLINKLRAIEAQNSDQFSPKNNIQAHLVTFKDDRITDDDERDDSKSSSFIPMKTFDLLNENTADDDRDEIDSTKFNINAIEGD